ncbi:hypothetical protein N7457_002267 [Penicillium paradoxum]|uniref:uncharacterized protein n=1 Tax=Penicillium paradoxum TaxID=176176 RepID=UPI002548AF52|nr:uncharacterized protein N7457_002267 [Penicillium paradoxum]KAJ5787277.1 hypothetical protein N7457_002267 [Penicillium paradoxum]
MAPITKTLALAGALFAMTGYSAPIAKRAVVWETVTDIVWTTVDVTTTIYPTQAAPTATVVPIVAHAAATTTAAPAPTVEAPKEAEKPAPTTSSTTTATPAPAPTVKAETSAPAPAPTVEAEAYSAPAPVVEVETSSVAPAPAPAPTEVSTAPTAPTSTAEAWTAPAPAATARATTNQIETITSSISGGHTGVCSEGSPCDGMITFYDTATTSTNPSSCGTTNDGTVENVLALPVGIMKDSDCGKTVTITYNGQTATGTVVDKCMGCDNTSVDLSRHFFGQLASMDEGRVSGAKWFIH